MGTLSSLLPAAIDARAALIDAEHHSACRLFNGFVEGLPALALDLYGTTLVLHDHSDAKTGDEALAKEALQVAKEKLPFIQTALWKVRNSENTESRNGVMLLGDEKQLADCVQMFMDQAEKLIEVVNKPISFIPL